ncbi:hypothetical protein OH492_28500 [Vibrio chagasii]|nr:hypothetical protein [Vibrio chagasii]
MTPQKVTIRVQRQQKSVDGGESLAQIREAIQVISDMATKLLLLRKSSHVTAEYR